MSGEEHYFAADGDAEETMDMSGVEGGEVEWKVKSEVIGEPVIKAEPFTPAKEQNQGDKAGGGDGMETDASKNDNLGDPNGPPVIVKNLHLIPDSFHKVNKLTVNIGPLYLEDIKSEALHEVLRLSQTFEMKFQTEEKANIDDATVKTGSVKIPFQIKHPSFLVRVAKKLGKLSINGKDMSVGFPEAFNVAIEDCKRWSQPMQRKVSTELKKCSIELGELPHEATAEQLQTLFPDAEKIFVCPSVLDDKRFWKTVFVKYATMTKRNEEGRKLKDVVIAGKSVRYTVRPDDALLTYTSAQKRQADQAKADTDPKKRKTTLGGPSRSGPQPLLKNGGAKPGSYPHASRGRGGAKPAFGGGARGGIGAGPRGGARGGVRGAAMGARGGPRGGAAPSPRGRPQQPAGGSRFGGASSRPQPAVGAPRGGPRGGAANKPQPFNRPGRYPGEVSSRGKAVPMGGGGGRYAAQYDDPYGGASLLGDFPPHGRNQDMYAPPPQEDSMVEVLKARLDSMEQQLKHQHEPAAPAPWGGAPRGRGGTRKPAARGGYKGNMYPAPASGDFTQDTFFEPPATSYGGGETFHGEWYGDGGGYADQGMGGGYY